MAFLEDLENKINKVSQSAVQKTKNFNDINKLNSSISAEEKKVNNLYVEIGKLYLNNHIDDGEEIFAPFIVSYKESTKKIQEYKNQIKEIKGIATCPNCGADVQKDVPFCSGCGTKMPEKEVDTVSCSNCGASMNNGTKFCTKCGTPLSYPDVAGAQTEEVQTESQQDDVQPVSQEVTVDEATEDLSTLQEQVIESAPMPEVVEEVAPMPEVVEEIAPMPEAVEEIAPIPEIVEESPQIYQPVEDVAKKCIGCGNVLGKDALFCTNCGLKAESKPQTVRFCTNCGNKLEEGFIFCTACGTKAD